MIKKQKIGDYVLYFEECPNCKSDRKLNQEKFAGAAGITLVGLGSSMILGGPVIGLFAVVGVLKLVMSGTIAASLAVRILSENYKFLSKLNDMKWFECSHCKCTDIFREDSNV